uniref:Putative secreted peptide n=1 Tax=Anopheles braziliensis TaxID=58242 RepID=A0A2M3ZPW9_9DIPT
MLGVIWPGRIVWYLFALPPPLPEPPPPPPPLLLVLPDTGADDMPPMDEDSILPLVANFPFPSAELIASMLAADCPRLSMSINDSTVYEDFIFDSEGFLLID